MLTFTLRDGRRVGLIGDPHMGRKFGPDQGVPAHRIGEREIEQAVQLQRELNEDVDIIVSVGDLFDTPFVREGVVVSVANILITAAEMNPDIEYYHMAGNHDLPKVIGTVGAWMSLRKMIDDRLPNLRTVSQPLVADGLALFPWEYDRRADEQVEDLKTEEVYAAVGHWDLAVYDGKDDHLAPVDALTKAFGADVEIYSGHYHKPGPYTVNGVVVNCTGSMQPYTHGEDPEGKLYVTVPLETLLAAPEEYKNKYVRVIVEKGEEIPEIDCRGLTHIRAREPEVQRETLSLNDFDWQKILRERILPLDPHVQTFIKERIHVDEVPEEQRGSSHSPS